MSGKTINTLAKFAKSLIKSNFCQSIVLAVEGGEPTLDISGLQNLVMSARKRGINEFIVCTNGSNLSKKTIDFLALNKIYPFISFESKKSFIKNRASRNSQKAGAIWHKINDSLNLFLPYLSNYNQDEIDDFDVIRGRVTITPSTIKYLTDSVEHLYKSPLGNKILITLMPAMSEGLDKEWRVFAENKKAIAILENEFKKIAELYLRGIKNKKPLNFCLNECLSLDFTDLSEARGLKEVPFCGAGNNLIGTDMDGNLFPCYLLAARPSGFREKFRIGDVFNGFSAGQEKITSDFCGKKQNKCFSCLYWNRIANNNPDKPAMAYVLLYKAWKKAVLFVKTKQKAHS
jgi:sulfatase maturation enzyme AslB (radical SAM superfamily)